MNFWRAAGLTYVQYSNIAARCTRNALRKELQVGIFIAFSLYSNENLVGIIYGFLKIQLGLNLKNLYDEWSKQKKFRAIIFPAFENRKNVGSGLKRFN